MYQIHLPHSSSTAAKPTPPSIALAFHPSNRVTDPASVVAVAEVAAAVLEVADAEREVLFVDGFDFDDVCVVVLVGFVEDMLDSLLVDFVLVDDLVDIFVLSAVTDGSVVELFDVLLVGCGAGLSDFVVLDVRDGGWSIRELELLVVRWDVVVGWISLSATCLLDDRVTFGPLRLAAASTSHGGSNMPLSATGKQDVHSGFISLMRVGIAITGVQGLCGYGVVVSASYASVGQDIAVVGLAGKL